MLQFFHRISNIYVLDTIVDTMLEFSDQVVEAMEGMKGSAEADVKRTKSISSMFATYLCDMLMANQCCDALKHIAPIFGRLGKSGADLPVAVKVLQNMPLPDSESPVDLAGLSIDDATAFRTCPLFGDFRKKQMHFRVKKAVSLNHKPLEQVRLLRQVIAHPESPQDLKDTVQRVLSIIDPGLPVAARLAFLVEAGDDGEQKLRAEASSEDVSRLGGSRQLGI